MVRRRSRMCLAAISVLLLLAVISPTQTTPVLANTIAGPYAALLAAYGSRIAEVEISRMKVNNSTSERL